MRLSKYTFKTWKENTNLDRATDRILRACYAQKESSGIFRFTNLGLRSLEKIKNVIRREMNKIGALEVELPILQDISMWEKSNRKEAYGPERFELKDRHDNTMILAPTAEESASEMIIDLVKSYKQLPISIYQMVSKYRDEMRPRFGLVRSRQFTMKDAYSFAKDEKNALEIYKDYFNAYVRIFNNLGFQTYAVPGETGDIGGKFCHEFVVTNTPIGECDMYFSKNLPAREISKLEDLDLIENSFEKIHDNSVKCLELGHIYYLAESYSKSMKIQYQDEFGKMENMFMGCYGIGVTRILSFAMEYFEFLPINISPFTFNLIGINRNLSEDFYNSLFEDLKLEVLYDDRQNSPGEKFSDGDLIGIPYRIVIGNKIEFNNLLKKEIRVFENIIDLKNYCLEIKNKNNN